MAKEIRALVIAGGGSGGTNAHGGGGAGGFRDVSGQVIVPQDYTVTVGLAGQNSSFGDLIVSLAGGDGGTNNGSSTNASPGSVGGSGGGGGGKNNGSGSAGAGGAGTSGQGYAGGAGQEGNSLGPPNDRDAGGGGGGGAGGVGAAPTDDHGGGNGGPGATSNISGSSVTYAEGGGGAGEESNGTGGGSQANTGNGGNGGAGGSGIVIIRYATANFGKCAGGTITTSGSDTIHTFTATGTFSMTDVFTNAVDDVDFATATGNGRVIVADGVVITERGVCWGTSTNPTTANSKSAVAGTVGTFEAPITGLAPNTTYYVKAYIIDSLGTTSYGDEVSFTTLTVEPDSLYKDINGVEGQTYAVQCYIGGTTGTLTVRLGSTGDFEVYNAGAGLVEFEGVYGGVNGLIFEASATFDGYVDNVYYVIVLGTATIDWDLDTLTNIYPIDSSVVFRRLEDKDFNRFRIYRYLDIQFKDLDAYVTVLLKNEANEQVNNSTKQFLVSNTSSDVLPFINKKVSFLAKNQAMLIGLSNNRLSETFTVCQFVVKGIESPPRTFNPNKIISV